MQQHPYDPSKRKILMFNTVASINNAPFSNPSVPRGDQRPAHVVDHAQRSAVSPPVASPQSAVVRLCGVNGEDVTYTARGVTYTANGGPPKTISLADNATAQGNESNVHECLESALKLVKFITIVAFCAALGWSLSTDPEILAQPWFFAYIGSVLGSGFADRVVYS